VSKPAVRATRSGAMANTRYFIFEDHNHWRIDFGGRTYGDFKNEQQALSKAIEQAFADSMRGHKAEILVRDERTGQFKVAWTYGR